MVLTLRYANTKQKCQVKVSYREKDCPFMKNETSRRSTEAQALYTIQLKFILIPIFY